MIRVVPATSEHAIRMAPQIRAADAAEAVALGGVAPLVSLLAGVAGSAYAWTMLAHGEPMAIGGLAPEHLLSDVARVWLLGTSAIDLHKRAFMVETRWQLAAALRRYRMVWNDVDARYAKAIRWLRWLGFTIGPTIYGGYEIPVCRVEAHR